MIQPKYWEVEPQDRQFDLEYLITPNNGYGRRFYSKTYARELSQKIQAKLKTTKGELEEYIIDLQDCMNDEYLCESCCCPICTTKYRRWLSSQLLQIAKDSNVSKRIATLLLAEVKKGELNLLDLNKYRASLYALLKPKFLKHHILGGFEVKYEPSTKSLILHCHLLIIGECKNAEKNLRKSFKRSHFERPVKFQKLRKNKVRQISYLLKFQTYCRINNKDGSRRGRAVMLKRAELSELICWTKRYKFSDFLFLFGARRHGSMISLNNRKNN